MITHVPNEKYALTKLSLSVSAENYIHAITVLHMTIVDERNQRNIFGTSTE